VRRGRRRRCATAVVAVAALLGGCGDRSSTLERADRALGELERGDISVAVRARAGEGRDTAGPVGFDIGGRFDIAADTRLPVLDLTYTRLLGDRREEMTVQSDGTRMVVTTDGVPVEVPPEQARRLELEGERRAGVGDLGVGGWITEASESDGPVVDGVPTRRVTGPVDAADLMSDLAALAGELSGQDSAPRLDEESAERVRSRLQSGDVEILVDGDDLPRRVRATADFGATVAPELRRALGPYAGASIEVTLEVRAPGQPVALPAMPR
jgi:hypothetical protein